MMTTLARRLAPAVLTCALLGVSDVGAQPAFACRVDPSATLIRTSATSAECDAVQARIDRFYGDKRLVCQGKVGTSSSVTCVVGSLAGNYVRSQSGGVWTTWIGVPLGP